MTKSFEEKILNTINALLNEKEHLLIAVDGRCASGKTTLADRLREKTDCNVIRTDHFFLPFDLRTDSRYNLPGGNFHRERFIEEVMIPLCRGESFSYRPFDCKTGDLGDSIYIPYKRINVIEGSYSAHPELFDKYDLRFFLTVDNKTQLERISERNGKDAVEIFKNKWIPLEERYFAAFSIPLRCDLLIDTAKDIHK